MMLGALTKMRLVDDSIVPCVLVGSYKDDGTLLVRARH